MDEYIINGVTYTITCDSPQEHATDITGACKKFYEKRIKAAEEINKELNKTTEVQNRPINGMQKKTLQREKSSLENAMDHLKREIASLVVQDVTLMKQLLTLNETIMDFKSQQILASHSRGSSYDGDWYYCDVESCDSRTSLESLTGSEILSTPSSSSSSAFDTRSSASSTASYETFSRQRSLTMRSLEKMRKSYLSKSANQTRENSMRRTKSHYTKRNFTPINDNTDDFRKIGNSYPYKNVRICHEKQSSFDSGIHGSYSESDMEIFV